MNCDDFLPALETGGCLRRWQARRHAARCSRCAAVYEVFTTMKQKLAVPEPLSPRARKLWEQAADASVMQPSGRRLWMPLGAGLAAAACLMLFVVQWAVRPEPAGTRFTPQPFVETLVEEVNPAGELSFLAAATERLDMQLKLLQEQAARCDAQREVALTLDRFRRW